MKNRKNSLVANNISEFEKIIENLHQPPNSQCSKRFFRGQADSRWEMRPSIARVENYSSNLEWKLIENIKENFPELFEHQYGFSQSLAMLQHFGIKTRMLDLTSSHYVALYFACSDINCIEFEGEVLVIDSYNDPYSPMADILASTAQFCSKGINTVQELLATSPILKNYNHTDVANALFNNYVARRGQLLTLKETSQRQISQKAVYLITPNIFVKKANGDIIILDKIKSYDKNNNNFADFNRQQVTQIRIPSKSKPQILSELNKLKINESTLFPKEENLLQEKLKDYQEQFFKTY